MDKNDQEESIQTQSAEPSLQIPQESPLNKTHSPLKSKIFVSTLVIVVLLAIGIALYILATKNNKLLSQKINQQKTSLSPTQPSKSTISKSLIITLGPLVSTSNWKTFIDPNYGYSYQYPSDWQTQGFPQKGNNTLPFGVGCSKTLINGQYVTTSCENNTYESRFTIPNTLSPNDSAFYVTIDLYNNDKNILLEQWVNTHHVTYADTQENHKYTTIMINNHKGLRDQITDTTDPRFDESFYINYVTKDNKNIIFAISIGGNGEGSTKHYSPDDPFVKKEIPIFEALVDSLNFASHDQMSGWRTYTNTNYGFTFQYPSSWIMNDSGSRIDIQKGDSVLTFYLYSDPDAGTSNYPLTTGHEILNIGNESTTFNEYTATINPEPSAYADVRLLKTIGKFTETVNFNLDKNNTANDLSTIKQILSSLQIQ